MRGLKIYITTGVILIFGIGLWLLLAKPFQQPTVQKENINPQTELAKFQNDEYGVRFEYPAEITFLKLNEQDRLDKFLFRASHDTNPPYLISLRYEDGLRSVSELSRTSTMALLLTNIDKGYPTRYPGYKKLSERQYEQNSKKVAQIEFLYTGKDGQSAYQSLYIYLKDENTAYYLSLQSRQTDNEQLKRTFIDIANSFKL